MNSFQLHFLAKGPLDVYENTSHFRRANDIVCGRPFTSRFYDHTRVLQRSQIAKIRLTPYYKVNRDNKLPFILDQSPPIVHMGRVVITFCLAGEQENSRRELPNDFKLSML